MISTTESRTALFDHGEAEARRKTLACATEVNAPSRLPGIPPPSVGIAAPGLAAIEQEFICHRLGVGLDVTGPYWVLALISVIEGKVRYLRGAQLVLPPGDFFAKL